MTPSLSISPCGETNHRSLRFALRPIDLLIRAALLGDPDGLGEWTRPATARAS